MARLTPPKSPMVYDKHHSGCMWGLYSLFDFRQANSNRKLISDANRLTNDVVIDDNNRTELDEKCQEENFYDMQNHRKLKKEEIMTLHSASDSVKQKQISQPILVEKFVDKLEKKKRVKKRKGCGCKNVDFVKYDELLKVNDVAEAIVNQKLIEGKYLSRDGVNPHSNQLLDALGILNSNKELFTKLLQDPNSLLVKHIQDLRDSQSQKQNYAQQSSSERERERRNEELASEIVVLKPGLMTDHRPTHFSFGDIKRKFKHAMVGTRKDPNLLPIDNAKQRSSSESRRSKEVRRHFQNNDTGKYLYDVQRRDKIEKLRDFKARIGQEMALRNEPKMYLDNKLHKRTMTSPEFDFLPLHSPERNTKSSLVASNMRFSPYSYTEVIYDNLSLTKEQKASYASSLKQNVEALIDTKKSYSHSQVSHTKPYEDGSSFRGESETNSKEVFSKLDESNVTEYSGIRDSEKLFSTPSLSALETRNVVCNEKTSLFEKPCTNQSSDTTNTNEETEDSESVRLDSSLEDQSSTCSKDIGESSPISVLEKFLTDLASPPSITCQPVLNSHLDPEMNSNTCAKISKYVKALLQTSGLNQDKLIFSCQSDKLFAIVNSQASQFCGDCKLIFDCVSEVLIELHENHLKHSPWLSFISPKTIQQNFQVEKFVTQEATKRVDFYFKSESESESESSQRSMDWLIGDDLRKSGSWLDLRSNVENIVIEVSEEALEELILETIDDIYYI